MEGIRLATPEEIEAIRKESDLGPTTSVLAFPGKEGTIFGCLKTVCELDPVFYNGASAQRKAMFTWGVENMLRFNGVPFYYFNILADDSMSEWRNVVKNWGAQEVSPAPEIRFKKVL